MGAGDSPLAMAELPPSGAQGRPLALTVNPRLDAALAAGAGEWDAAAREAGATVVAGWLAQRLGDPALRVELLPTVQALLESDDTDERAQARADLADVVGETDAAVADALWEGVRVHGLATEDPDVLFEATARLAAIAEAHGDPLSAAEYYLDFLNWRRQPGHTSDTEHVQTAFDEVIRLAGRDGEHRAAALFGYRQVAYTRLAESEDDRATAGDWEPEPAPYQSWG